VPQAKQLKRRNHTVNKSYLQRFADDRGLLAGVGLPGDHRFSVSIDDATVIRNFYVVRLPDGSETDQAEDEFWTVLRRPVLPLNSANVSSRWQRLARNSPHEPHYDTQSDTQIGLQGGDPGSPERQDPAPQEMTLSSR
jgi:hypothetical protein